MSTLCSKCGEINARPIVDRCTKCGQQPDAAGRRQSMGRPVAYSDSRGTPVNSVTLTSLAGKSAAEESKELMRWAQSMVPDAPAEVQELSDGICICKLIVAVAPMAKPRYNPRPKMVLQKLNNVAVAMEAMEALGIHSAGINTKDVVDGNEKEIMNILRSLHLYSKRGKSSGGGHSRRASFSADKPPAVSVVAAPEFDGASLAAAADRRKTSAPDAMAVSTSPRQASPRTSPGRVGAASATAETSVQSRKAEEDEEAARLKELELQADLEIRTLDEKINAMNRHLGELSEEHAPTAKKSPRPPASHTVDNKPPALTVTPLDGPGAEESSTEGEEDSVDKSPRPKSGDARGDALEKLRQWKEEEKEKVRIQAEEQGVGEIKAVQAGTPPAPDAASSPSTSHKSSRSRKVARRRKRKPNRPSKASSQSADADGVGAGGSEEEDSGISDSPDPSDDEAPDAVATPPMTKLPSPRGESPTPGESPSVPQKSDRVRSKIGRNRRRGSMATRVVAVETSLDAVIDESEALKKERQAAQEADLLLVKNLAASNAQGKWYVSPLKQEELQKLGENPVALKGVTRMQALMRAKKARRKRKLLSKRAYIAREVVESEKAYVRNLGLCIDHFYEPMSKLAFINDLQLRQMFSEISVIRGYNSHLCKQLEDRQRQWAKSGQKLGDIFLGFVAYFRTYTSYVNNYNDAMVLFYQLQAKNKSFQSFLAEKKVEQALNGIELPAFLIMPIQRLPRYVMLLEDLLKNTPDDHADFENLSTALSKVQEVADYVNEKKREAENVNQVLDVQARLSGMGKNLAEPHRRFVRQGAVLNVDKKGESMLFLFNDILVVAKESHGLGKLTEKGKEMLGFKKGNQTPKMGRKAHASPFFGKKKPQLQAEVDDREYKYQKTISLADCKVSAQFGMSAQGGAAASAGLMGTDSVGRKTSGPSAMATESGLLLTIKTPVDQLYFSTNTEEELSNWVHDLDATAMRLVERKRLRCERTAKHHDGSDTFLVPTGGRRTVNKSDASFAGRVMLKSTASNTYEWKYVCLVKPHMYVFNTPEDDDPQGWLYLLTSHVVMGTAEMDPVGWSFQLHVPHVNNVATASTWMSKHSVRAHGHSGNPNMSTPVDKEVVNAEDQDRDVYSFMALNVNEVLNWCREIRNVILDSVKLPDDLCPLEVIQRLPDEGNTVCADCGFEPTSYASINLGVFLCAACAELHNELLAGGISVVRDIKEPWDISPQHRFELEALMGNNKRNKIFEKNASKKDVPKAKSNDTREARSRWIKAKYTLSGMEKESSLGASYGGSSSPNPRRMSLNQGSKQ